MNINVCLLVIIKDIVLVIIFIVNEEKVLMDYIMYMRDIGYGNNKVGIFVLVRIYVVFFGKIIKGKNFGFLFSNCWCFGFLGRW